MVPSENGIGAILKNCTKIWAPLPISGVRCLNLSCGKKRSWHIMCHWYHDVVIDREKERSHCIKKNLNMLPRSQKKGPRLPCTCTVCRGAVMSARTVCLHNSRPRYNPTLKGVTVKESEISRGLVSPARGPLKNFWLWPNFGWKMLGKITHQAYAQNRWPTFQI